MQTQPRANCGPSGGLARRTIRLRIPLEAFLKKPVPRRHQVVLLPGWDHLACCHPGVTGILLSLYYDDSHGCLRQHPVHHEQRPFWLADPQHACLVGQADDAMCIAHISGCLSLGRTRGARAELGAGTFLLLLIWALASPATCCPGPAGTVGSTVGSEILGAIPLVGMHSWDCCAVALTSPA